MVEILQERQETAKTFDRGNGQRTVAFAGVPIHYKETAADYLDPEKQWLEADPLSRVDQGDHWLYDKMHVKVRQAKTNEWYEVEERKTGQIVKVELDSPREGLILDFEIVPRKVMLWMEAEKSRTVAWKITKEGEGNLSFRDVQKAFAFDGRDLTEQELKKRVQTINSKQIVFQIDLKKGDRVDPTTETFGTSTTWTAPAGVTLVDAECWGSGGAGTGDNGSSSSRRNGGGGGAYSKTTSIVVVPLVGYTVTVGQGGVGVSNFNAAEAGEDSWFLDALTVLAKGGDGGGSSGSTVAQASGGQAAAGVGDVGSKFSGGNSPGHSTAFQGRSAGGGAGDAANGGNASDAQPGTVGAGGSAGGGDGGLCSNTLSEQDGKAIGGGGGDRLSSSGRGGHGYRGEVRLTYTAATGTTHAQECSAVLSLMDTLNRYPQRTFLQDLVLADSVSKSTGRTLSDVLVLNDVIETLKAIFKELTEQLVLNDSITRFIGAVKTETLTLTDTITRTIQRTIDEVITFTDSVLKATYRTLTDPLVLNDVFTATKITVKELVESLVLNDSIVRFVGAVRTETLTLTDSITRRIERTFEDTVTLVDSALKTISRTVTETITLVDTFIGAITTLVAQSIGSFILYSVYKANHVLNALRTAFTLYDTKKSHTLKDTAKSMTLYEKGRTNDLNTG